MVAIFFKLNCISVMCYNNHLLKYHDYYKYHNIHLVVYNNKTKIPHSYVVAEILYYISFRIYALHSVAMILLIS